MPRNGIKKKTENSSEKVDKSIIDGVEDHEYIDIEQETKVPEEQFIFIYEKWCKGCGICAALCPFGVLKMNILGIPEVVAPEKCTRCKMCMYRCPDFAINIKANDSDEENKLEGGK